jgi:hypothetical protein
LLLPNTIGFSIEWTSYILLQFLRGEIRGFSRCLVAYSLLIFFYLLGCVFTHMNTARTRIAVGWKKIALGISFALLDQILKILSFAFIPFQTSQPIIQFHIRSITIALRMSSFVHFSCQCYTPSEFDAKPN